MTAVPHRTRPKPDDPTIIQSITQDIRNGIPLRYAAFRAGVHCETAYLWNQRGALAYAHPEAPPQTREELGSHGLFHWEVNCAQADFVAEALTKWQESEGKEFAKWATLLERRDPEHFSRYQRIDVTQRTLSVSVALPPDALPALYQLLSRDPPLLPPPALPSEHTPGG